MDKEELRQYLNTRNIQYVTLRESCIVSIKEMNTATIYLQTQELLVLLAEHGSAFSIVDFEGN